MADPRLTWRLIAAVLPLATVVSHSFGRSTYPLLLPVIRDDILASNTEAGIAGTAVFVAYLAGVILTTAMALRLEPIVIMRAGLGLAVIGLAVLAVAKGLTTLILGLALVSVAGAGIWITAPVLITDGVPPRRRGLVIGLLSASIGMANAVVAGGTRLAWTRLGAPTMWRPVFGVEGAVSLAVLVAVLVAVRPAASARVSATIRLDALRHLPSWFRLTAAYVCFGVIAAGFVSFLAATLEDDAGLSRPAVATVFAGMGLASVAGAPLAGWLADRLGRRVALGAVMVAMAVGCLCVALVRGPLLIGAVVGFGGFWASYPTLTATFVRDHLDSREFSAAFGVMTIAYGIAAVFPPLLVGLVADAFGTFSGVYLVLTAIAVLGALLLLGVEEPGLEPGL